MTSLYFIITTATTVGYGDMPISTDVEMCFAMVFMVTGQIGLTYAISLLGSILASWDGSTAKLEDKVNMLNNIYFEYKLPLELYARLK